MLHYTAARVAVPYACPPACNTTSAFSDLRSAAALLQCSFRTRSFSEPRSLSCKDSVVGQTTTVVMGQPGRRTSSPRRGKQTTVQSNACPRPPPVSRRAVGSRVFIQGERLERPKGRSGRGRTRNKSGGDSKSRCDYVQFTSVAVRYCLFLAEDGLIDPNR